MLQRVFEVCDRTWRGIGPIPLSGWRLRDEYRAFDAEVRFDVGAIRAVESPLCRSGEVLQGVIAPTECAAFGRQCTAQTPIGATMVCSIFMASRTITPSPAATSLPVVTSIARTCPGIGAINPIGPPW